MLFRSNIVVNENNNNTGRNVGDTVTINGVYTSSSSTKKLSPAVKSGMITRIIPGARNPYLINNGNIGWVNDSCIVSSGSSQATNNNTNTAPNISVGSTVTLSSNATNYATGQKIPECYRNRNYTIMQVGNGKVLLKELYSWVYTKDLVGYGAINVTPTSNRNSNEEIAKDIVTKPNFDGWGTGETRKQKLRNAGYDPSAIQGLINQMLR